MVIFHMWRWRAIFIRENIMFLRKSSSVFHCCLRSTLCKMDTFGTFHLDERWQNCRMKENVQFVDMHHSQMHLYRNTLSLQFLEVLVEPILWYPSAGKTDELFHLDTRIPGNPFQVKHQNMRFYLNSKIVPERLFPFACHYLSTSCMEFWELMTQQYLLQ